MTAFLILSAFACTNGKISTGDAYENTETSDSENVTADPESEEDSDDGTSSNPENNDDDSSSSDEDGSDDETPEDGDLSDEETDTGTATEPAEDITLEEYVATYCATFAIPCVGGYGDLDACVELMMDVHFTDCTVVDYGALAECDSWVSTIECSETSWLPACDDFIDCD